MRIALIWTLKEFFKRGFVLFMGILLILMFAQLAEYKEIVSEQLLWTALPPAACGAAAWTLFSWRHEGGDVVLCNAGVSPLFIWAILLILAGCPFALRIDSAPSSTGLEWSNGELVVRHDKRETHYRWVDDTVRRSYENESDQIDGFPRPKGDSNSSYIPEWVAHLLRGSALGMLLWWQSLSPQPKGPLSTLAATGLCITTAQVLPGLVL